MRRALPITLALAVLSGGCSLLFDGSSHRTGGTSEDGGIDGAAPPDSCDDHYDCLLSAAPVFVCADRGDGDRCYELCEGDAECAGHPDGTLCIDGLCSCNGDADCIDGRCDTAEQLCVECLEDAHCPSDTPVCDSEGDCIACAGPADCEDPSLPACDTDSGRCVRCVDPSDCASGETCSAAFECVPESCDADGDGFPADRPECTTPGEPADCADGDPNRYPGNTPICDDGQVQGCPDDIVSQALGELGLAEIGPLAAAEVGTPTLGTEIDQLSVALKTASQETTAPDAYVVWHETPAFSTPSEVTFHGYNFDGSGATPRTVDVDGVCSGTLNLRAVHGVRVVAQGNVLRLVTTGRADQGGSTGGFVAWFDAFPERTLLQAVGPERCVMTIDSEAPPTEPGMLDVDVAAAAGILDLDVGPSFSRGVTLLNTTQSTIPLGMATTDPVHTWMESSRRFVFGGTSDPTGIAGGAVDAHADDASVSITLDADSAGRGALTSIPNASGTISYFLATADAGGTIARRSWQCGASDTGCFDGTADVIGSHDGAPLLDATPIATTHVALVSARDRTGPSDARDVMLHIVPFDASTGTGVSGIPLLTTRDHGIAAPLIRQLAVTSGVDMDGNATLVVASVVERTTGDQAVWARGIRFCAAP